MFDYQSLTLTTGEKFDLHGVQYLHPLTDWLYFGAGLSGPMLHGDYGGFFTAAATLHAQQRLFGNWYVDAGLSVGAGAGGSSVQNIKVLSGDGTYVRKYAGLGYDMGGYILGVNYSDVAIANSQIDGASFSFFVQKPISYSIGSYGDSGRALGAVDADYRAHESIVSFDYNHVTQINPTGKYGGDIGLVSPQYSQFIDDDTYWFLGLDLGYSGLIWYNQAQGGFGRRLSLTPNFHLYGQLGLGTGGWVTDTFDTGPGLVIYPKVKAELRQGRIGATASAGYYWAPMGTSKNWTIGAGLNYHFDAGTPAASGPDTAPDSTLRGIRLNLFDRYAFAVESNGQKIDNLNLVALQADYAFDDHWYVTAQIAAATNQFKGYAGYVEGLVGIGWQSDMFFSDRLQGFAQVMYGMNDIGIDAARDVGALLYPSVGLNYSLSDNYAIYGQFGKTASLGQYLEPNFTNSFENLTVGLGLTYRFSSPD
ncbi:hypothetical protein STA1M1_33020 [Sinisalibacter aestuarii]|uniref:Porin n=2 Tax=Sinisalibacter aestuarii TaxID=2949426 RepID=A0ABQ5LXT6_9RHOB|nr:hypothetical protein STA1M1_33020 [Sinisalibacter aestuarii]